VGSDDLEWPLTLVSRSLIVTNRRRGHHPASYCSSHISAWLLQFFASWASTLYNTTAPTRSERRCSTDIRTQSVRAHHTKRTPVTLATHTLARPVQTMLLYACSCHRTLSSVSGEHRATSYTFAFRSATVIFRLLSTADKDQVRRAGLLLCRPVCVEHTAAPYPRNSRLR